MSRARLCARVSLLLACGATFAACQGSRTGESDSGTSAGTVYASNGARIYYTAATADAPILVAAQFGDPPSRATRSCADCHGADGAGLVIETDSGFVQAPDIRYARLTAPGTYAQGRVYDDATLALTLRTGVRVDGYLLSSVMPRWVLSAEDMQDLLAHLKTLGAGHAVTR
jgi:cytochrome c553